MSGTNLIVTAIKNALHAVNRDGVVSVEQHIDRSLFFVGEKGERRPLDLTRKEIDDCATATTFEVLEKIRQFVEDLPR